MEEPNVLAIATYLRDQRPDLLTQAHRRPSMEPLTSDWTARHEGGVRIARQDEIRGILAAGDRAFNLRVADPHLPYQKQELGLTWSFLTPRDKQDLHVHGLPAVEIYGVLEGSVQLWHKPMNQRGARVWQSVTLGPGDWAEVEPLNCHFACWATPEGLGTVVKASATGSLAGVGNLGVSGKTTCPDCNVHLQCALYPRLVELIAQYTFAFEQRDYDFSARLVEDRG